MLDICSVYADCLNLVFNPAKTICSVVSKQRFRISDVYLDNHVIQWCDNFEYLGVTFSCSDELVVDIPPVRRCFYVACSSVITRIHEVAEPVRVQLIESFCLPLLVHCIGALSLKRSAVHMLSVCWNDALDVFSTIKEVNQLEFSKSVLGRWTLDICTIYIDGDFYAL